MVRTILWSGLLLAAAVCPAAFGQDLPPVGTDGTLDVATWNIEWFGATGSGQGPSDEQRQLENAAAIISEADLDLWAVQEIADETDFAELLAMLGDDYAGTLATESSQQRIGFIYKTGVIQPRSIQHILTSFDYEFAGRPPLQLDANVTLADTTVRVVFITVHMKAFSDAESYERRAEAAGRLKNRIDFLLPNDRVVVLGDFNDELRQSIFDDRPSPYASFVEDTDDYQFVTMPLDEGEVATFCGGSSTCSGTSTIDHILLTDELFTPYIPGSAARYDAVISAIPGYVTTTSDHLPVYARFAFARSTSITPEQAVPNQPTLVAYPNPFDEELTLRYALDRPGPVRVTVYDLLGRSVWQERQIHQPAGSYTQAIPSGAWSPGVYVVHLQTNKQVRSRLLTKVR